MGKRWNDGEHCTLFPDTTIPNMEKYFHSLTPKNIYNIIMPFIHRTNTINYIHNTNVVHIYVYVVWQSIKSYATTTAEGQHFYYYFQHKIAPIQMQKGKNFTGIFVEKRVKQNIYISHHPPKNINNNNKKELR